MPVIRVDRERLGQVVGKDVDDEALEDALAMMGCVPEETDGSEWAVEVFPDRPDLLTTELLGRALQAYLGKRPGLRSYEAAEAVERLVVDPSVEDVRPVIVAGRVHGISLDDASLKGLMDLQEDLHWGLGARRRKVSIGVHDASGIEPPYTYKGVDPDAVRFVPLRDAREMTMREMVKTIEKGVAYAHLVEGHARWPLIVDANDQVLSFPPIINGTVTTLTEETTEVLVDVTGQDERACRQVLSIVMAHLAELGGALEQVTVETEGGVLATPDLAPVEQVVDLARAQGLLGIAFTAEDAAGALERMGFGAEPSEEGLAVTVPGWRSDVLHEVDLIEDIAIGLGYDRFEGTDPTSVTFGEPSKAERYHEQVRRAMTGLGYLECLTLTLRSRSEQTTDFGAEEPLVAVENPVSSEQSVLRRRLLPSLLSLAAGNTHRDLPQRLFEVGEVVLPGEPGQGPPNEHRVAGLVVANEAGFTGIKSHVEALLRSLGLRGREHSESAPGFVPGRCARLEDKETGRVLGVYGEIAPATLERFDLATPCAGFELTLAQAPGQPTWAPEQEPDPP